MRCTYIGLAAALSGMGMGARIEKFGGKEVDGLVGNHRILADVGSHRKNASSVSAAKMRGDYAQLELRQAGGACGAQAGRCTGGLCCSDYGFCGDSVDHCAPLFNCQPQYGVCGWPRSAATTSAPPPPPTTSAPPPPPTTTSAPPPPPTTSAPPPPPTTTSTSTVISTTIVSLPPPTTTSRPVVVPPSSTVVTPQPTGSIGGLRITPNGQCGNGTTCIGNSNYGPCCSQFFWCGSSLDFCGAGCKSDFGACLGIPGLPAPPAANVTSIPAPTTRASTTSVPPVVISTSIISLPPPTTSAPPPPPTTSAPPPPPTTSTRPPAPTTTAVTLPPGMRSTTDGKCGSGVTCLGSTFGRCCSQFGWCGDGDQFCPPIVGCQAQFGSCDP